MTLLYLLIGLFAIAFVSVLMLVIFAANDAVSKKLRPQTPIVKQPRIHKGVLVYTVIAILIFIIAFSFIHFA